MKPVSEKGPAFLLLFTVYGGSIPIWESFFSEKMNYF